MAGLKMTESEGERRDVLVADLRTKRDKLSGAISDFNVALETARAELRVAVEDYNETITEAKGFAEDKAREIEDAIDSKSEKWQEGEKGEAASAWKEAWEEIDSEFEELDADQMAPSDMEDYDDEFPEKLEGISIEPEGSY